MLNHPTTPHCQACLFGGTKKTVSAYLGLSRLQQLPAVPQQLATSDAAYLRDPGSNGSSTGRQSQAPLIMSRESPTLTLRDTIYNPSSTL